MIKDIAQKRYGIHTAHSNTWIYITRRPKITVDRDIIEKRIRICSSIEKKVERIICGERCRNLVETNIREEAYYLHRKKQGLR